MKFGRVLLSVLGGAAALFIASAPLRASGDFGCYPAWKLASTSYDCAGRAVLTPGNDSWHPALRRLDHGGSRRQ